MLTFNDRNFLKSNVCAAEKRIRKNRNSAKQDTKTPDQVRGLENQDSADKNTASTPTDNEQGIKYENMEMNQDILEKPGERKWILE